MTDGQRKSTLFREVNERVREISAQWDATTSVGFFCECSDTSCSELLDLTLVEYEAIRATSDRFVVVCGHESPGHEHGVPLQGERAEHEPSFGTAPAT